MPNQKRQLAAILFTDIVGYTALMQENEQNAVFITKRYMSVLKECVSLHDGNILNDFGDGSLCSFNSATEALRCSIKMQQLLQQEPKVPLRIGLHIGEIFFEDEKVMGDGVNIASRIQSLGQANTILFSKEIFDKIRNQLEFKSVFVGSFEFKNVDDPMQVFALANDELIVPEKKQMTGKLKEIQKKPAKKKWILGLTAIIILAISALFIAHGLKNKKGFTGDKSIVVLPFENYTNDAGQENLINSITEEITTQLAKIADIKVIGRISAVSFMKQKKPLDQIAEVLGVSAYLEGSVSKAGDKIRITAQLIDANTQEHIWAESYTRDMNDVFSMQIEVAQQIAGQLHAKLTEEEKNNINKKPTDNMEAYKYYRKGRFFWGQRTKESFDSAEVNYNKAIALDPDYALAYSGLTDLYIYPNNGMSQLEAMPIAKDYATKAFGLDSTLSEPLTTLGFIQSAFDYDWAKSKITLMKAIALNGNYPTSHLFFGNLLQYTHESTEKGINEIKKALALDPLSVNPNYVLGRNFYYAKKYDSAYEQLKKTLAFDPNFNLAKGNLIYIFLERKNYPEAINLIKQLPLHPTSKIFYSQGATLSYAYAVSGDIVSAKNELDKTLAEFPDQSTYNIARVYIPLNDYNNALNNLEKAYQQRDIWMYILNVDPTFDPIRNEPRFIALLKKMRLE